MSKRPERRRWIRGGRRATWAALLLVVALIVSAGGTSQGAVRLFEAGPGSAFTGYYTPVVVVPRGTFANFGNLDIALHDVRSGTPKAPTGQFFAPLIGLGKTTRVINVEFLPRGTYKFYCSLHPVLMKGFLQVV